MKSISRTITCIFFVFLTISSSFAPMFLFSIAVAEAREATCGAISEEESNWPSVTYCSRPLNIPIKTGEVYNLPADFDAWTEYQSYLSCWYAFPKEFRSDSKVGTKSFYGEAGSGGIRAGFPCLTSGSINIDIYDELHFWFKSIQSGPFTVYFDAEDGAPYEITCNLGEYNSGDGWKEYNISIGRDCRWLTEKKSIQSFGFDLQTASGGTTGYIDNLYLTHQPTQSNDDNRYFVYVSKSTDEIPVELSIQGIDPNDPSFMIESLNPNVARWDASTNKIIVGNNGTFIIHYSSDNALTLTPSHTKVGKQPIDKCSDLVEYMIYLQESGRQRYVNLQDHLAIFGGVVGAGFGVVFSQISEASKTGANGINLVELLLNAAKDEVGTDNVLFAPRGSIGYIWTGRDTFPYSFLGDLDFVFLFDDSVYTTKSDLEYRILSKFKIYAEANGLIVEYVPRDLAPWKITFPDGKIIYYDWSLSEYIKISDAPTEISVGRDVFFGTENAMEKLGTALSGTDIDDVKTTLKGWYELGYEEADGWTFGPDEWVDLRSDGIDVIEGPEKAYKKLAFLSQLKGDPIEIQHMYLERYDYWRGILNNEKRMYGDYRPETLESFQSEIKPQLEIDFYPFETGSETLFSSKISSQIENNILVYTVRDKTFYRLKNAISDIRSFLMLKNPELTNLDTLATSKSITNMRLEYIEVLNKKLNEGIDEQDIEKLMDIQEESDRLLRILPEDVENVAGIRNVLQAIKDAAITGINSNGELTSDLEVNLKKANTLAKDVIFEGRLKSGDDVGNIHTELENRGYNPTDQPVNEIKEAKNEFYDAEDRAGNTVENPAEKQSLESLDNGRNSDVKGQISDDAINPKSKVLQKYGGLIWATGLTALFAIGPLTREYGNIHQDKLALAAADVIQIAGFLAIGYLFLSSIHTLGYVQGILSALILLIDPINILGPGFAIDIPGFIVFLVVSAIINYIWCHYLEPSSALCGCTSNPAYNVGKPLLRLEKNIVGQGETIDFAIYGMQHCEGDFFGMSIAPYTGLLKIDGSSVGGCPSQFGNCCCDGNISIQLNSGNHLVKGEMMYVLTYEIEFSTDEQTLTVCPSGYVGDETENKCITCDYTTHTQTGEI